MQDKPAPRICSVPGCGAPLRASNTIGRCRPHSYVPAAGDVCGADGCETVLRKDNTTGFCTPHKRAKNRPGPVPKRKFTARVYTSRPCPDCGEPFTPASASQQRCTDCRDSRERPSRSRPDDQWAICSVDGCDAKLRTSNATGRCSPHRYFIVRDVCAVDGCVKQLRTDNDTGYCKAHKYAKAREPVRPCGAPGCDRVLRTDNVTGYCPDHIEPGWQNREYLDRKYAKERAERAQRPDVRRTCYIDGCDRKIRSDNTSGRCSDHTYVPMEWSVCSVDGCDARVKPSNTLGRCFEHRGLYWGDPPPKCGEPGCGKDLLRDNTIGFCHEHRVEYRKAYNRDYYRRHQAEMVEYARQYREVYTDEHRAAASAWNAANREARLAADGRRRLAASAGMDDFDRELSVAYRLCILHDPCFYCGATETHHVDHFFPLVKGGTDHWENLVRSCSRCNLRKSGTMCGTKFLLLSGG